ncbi:MAG: hypothetical protein LBR15_04010 [Methanobrevibacter sp.]|jgi:hypothetical protein|nr:hypothetical protein [Candidatus Methanovirga australis]
MISSSPKPKKSILTVIIFILLISILPIIAITNLNFGGFGDHQASSNMTLSNNTTQTNDNTKENMTAIETISYKFVSNTKDAAECASVIIYSNNNSSTYGYRRDSTDRSDQYINKVKISGEGGLIESNNTDEKKSVISFIHSLVLDNGWYMGIGGLDNPKINKKLEKFGLSIAMKGSITYNDMEGALTYIKAIGGGHFVIKSPSGKIGVVSYYSGNYMVNTYQLENDDYVVVPNSPNFFYKGTLDTKKGQPIDAAFYLLSIDKFGVNRRNSIVLNVHNITGRSQLNVYVANDDGVVVGRSCDGLSDDVIFNGKRTNRNSIPKVSNDKLFLGSVEV